MGHMLPLGTARALLPAASRLLAALGFSLLEMPDAQQQPAIGTSADGR